MQIMFAFYISTRHSCHAARTRLNNNLRYLLMRRLLLASAAALLMATSATHARPDLSKQQSWKLIQGTWCMSPADKPGYLGDSKPAVGTLGENCSEDDTTLIIRDKGYEWVGVGGMTCRYTSGKARIVNTIPASTKTMGVYVFRIVSECSNKLGNSYQVIFDMYVTKGTLFIEKPSGFEGGE
jgi:hypothetical protein